MRVDLPEPSHPTMAITRTGVEFYDSKLRLLTSSNPDHPTGNIFDPRELALLAQAMEHDTRGGIRMNSRYVSWERLDHFDGVLVRVHTLSEGVQSAPSVEHRRRAPHHGDRNPGAHDKRWRDR